MGLNDFINSLNVFIILYFDRICVLIFFLKPIESCQCYLYTLMYVTINLRPTALNAIEERVGHVPELMGTAKDFLNRALLMQVQRPTIDKWDHVKLKSFYTAKDIIIRVKRKPTE